MTRQQELQVPGASAEQPCANAVHDRFIGCLVGGAVGDALGAPVEFLSREQIASQFGKAGVRDYIPAYGGLGRVTDDTQLTLFTADGLIRSAVRKAHKGITSVVGVTAHAYLRWYMTQFPGVEHPKVFGIDSPGWLYAVPELHARRAPGLTCMAALQAMSTLGAPANNDSKGCGAVMRVAPVGLWMAGLQTRDADALCFSTACELARLTHGHPTGQLAAGVFAVLVRHLASGGDLVDGLHAARSILVGSVGKEETLEALDHAVELARESIVDRDTVVDVHHANVAALGEGWVAEEALAIAVYCALVARDFEEGVVLAINHDGGSDSTGSMAGNLLGCIAGSRGIPERWRTAVEIRDVVEAVASDLYHFGTAARFDNTQPDIESEETWSRYPGY